MRPPVCRSNVDASGPMFGPNAIRRTVLISVMGMRIVKRTMFALVMGLLVAGLLSGQVEAKRIPANGVSIASRVQAQKDICTSGGGSFESSTTAFGSTITKCTGGDDDGYTCVNTVQSTNCHGGLVRPD